MGKIISEQNFIESNIFAYENRMNSQYSRFLDKTPTYVTYYNISNVESTVDNGFQQSEEIIGSNSSIRFNKIDNFPIYGIEQIVLDLQDDEEGLTTSYESEAVILPNTAKPRPGDFFVINHLDIDIQFMVIEIKFDTIKSNNFYKISFMMKSLSSTEELDNQVVDKFKCISTNIGTEESCLIKEDEYYKLKDLYEYTDELINRYKLFFYDPRRNMFLIKHNDGLLHDPYLTNFLIKNNVFFSKNKYDTMIPNTIGSNISMGLFYELSMYRHIELNQKPCRQKYSLCNDNDMYSPIRYYGERGYIVELSTNGTCDYLPEEFFYNINNCIVGNTSLSKYSIDLIVLYLNNKLDSVNQIDIEKLKTEPLMSIDRESMIVYGILLYVLITSYRSFIRIKK